MRLYDAHNHLQDDRLAPFLGDILSALPPLGIARMVVNGSCEADWPLVAELAKQSPQVLPSFGYHPWYVHERTADWQVTLTRFLDDFPAAVGEIGLDKWILERPSPAASLPEQEEVFVWQLRLAAERDRPVSIHCLQAWGAMLGILQREPRPGCGFVLHSYGGPREMVAPLAKLGAYFSFPGFFAHERKHRQREAFLAVPPDRLLIETDAPDQLLPEARNRYPLVEGTTGKALNHPANLGSVYEYAAELFEEPVEQLASRVEQNFNRIFGGLAV